ncbi:MAG TPA: EI24 domain-containing protein [Bacteroidetes bacterium]|nr:EI24 domain-containing protein [Bacteroidota bacterium]
MIKNTADGIRSYGAAMRHISKHGMWAYILLPGLLCLVLGGIIISAAWGFSDDLGGLISNFWKWDFGKPAVEKIVQVFGGLLILAFGAVFFKQIIMVVLAPFMSILSEKVEKQLTGEISQRSFSVGRALSDIVRGLRIATRNIIRELLATVFLLLIGLVPTFAPFTTVLIFLIQSYYAGFGNMDYTLERHFSYKNSIRFVKKNRGLALGNGIVFMLLFFTVIGFLFALPLGTVAATIQTVKKLENK